MTFFQNKLDNAGDDIDLSEVLTIQKNLTSIQENFNSAQSQLEMNYPQESDETERSSFDEAFYSLETRVQSLIDKLKKKSLIEEKVKMKLPDVSVPKFDGKINHWIPFKESFSELIGKRELDNVSKYQYLEASLIGGKAHSLIQNSNSNYVTAWSRLLEEYDKKIEITECHLQGLYDVSVEKKDDAVSLQKFWDTVELNLAALKSLEAPVDNWNMFLVFHLSQKLDISSRKEFEKVKKNDQFVTFDEFKSFVKNRIRMLSAISNINPGPPLASSTPKSKTPIAKSQPKSAVFVSQGVGKSCFVCGGNHIVNECQKLLSLGTQGRSELVKSKNLCFNCLKPGHAINSCFSSFRCRECKGKHHTLLHKNSGDNQNSEGNPNSQPKSNNSNSSAGPEVAGGDSQSKGVVLTVVSSSEENQFVSVPVLPTAIVLIQNRNQEFVLCRALLDGASTKAFITEELVQKLSLRKRECVSTVVGINSVQTKNQFVVSTKIKSRISEYEVDLEFSVSKKITPCIPNQLVNISKWKLPEIEKLADPTFTESGKIDILLPAEILFECMTGEKSIISEKLFAFPSHFGIIVAGKFKFETENHSFCAIEDLKLQIQKFWEMENVNNIHLFTKEEKQAERHYVSTVKRMRDGRYILALPLNENVVKLGESKFKAKQIFLSAEAKLMSNPEKQKHYNEFMQEMLDLGHMELADDDAKIQNYIIHHLITRLSSTTTKYRVVFNASFKTSSGLCLNNCVLTGPIIQNDVFTHLIHWRQFLIALTGDIEKMYRQIALQQEFRDYLRIFYRFSPSEEVKSYRLTTVTYGTACAPFQAIRTLKEIAKNESNNFPDTAMMFSENFYVDDLIVSLPSLDIAIKTKEELIKIAENSKMTLRKWNSNDKSLESDICDEIVSVLGVEWEKNIDAMTIRLNDIKIHDVVSRSSILSEIAQFFDPLGLCQPVVVIAKMFLQRIWRECNTSWKDELPAELVNQWSQFRESLRNMKPFSVPRCLMPVYDAKYELHGFCDASNAAYGACVYIRQISDADVQVRLVAAKSRVAPIRKLSIPRLELNGAMLLSELVKKVRMALNYPNLKTYQWTDSEINLYRIRSTSNKFGTYVALRVGQIQENTLSLDWNFVPTSENPADVVSRGLQPSELESCDIWWNGPPFLKQDEESWPSQSKFEIFDEEEINTSLIVTEKPKYHVDEEIINRQSKFEKLIRVVAYMIRFRLNSIKSRKYRNYEIPNVAERDDALLRVVRIIQSNHYHDELLSLMKNKSVEKSSSLKLLSPFLDESKIIRAKGLLEFSHLSWESKHPIILPKGHFSTLIIEYYHERNMHCGPTALLNTVRQKFWIVDGRSTCKKVVFNCIECYKNKPTLMTQVMGQHPKSRLYPTLPFTVVGIDFCGPFDIKYKVRTNVVTKAYVCIFSCFVTRATHLEVVSDLTTKSFLQALIRFVSRRGIPSDIYSDNATNFVGANNELKELHDAFLNQSNIDKIKEYCYSNGITWHFIPPRTPHFGGLWESIVKQFKYHLKRITRQQKFTLDELETLTFQIEAILNSRPLFQVTDDINDMEVLTPGHFLILRPLNAIPEPRPTEVNPNRLSIYKRIQFFVNEFWHSWKRDYLAQLQKQSKWFSSSDNVKVGQLVLLHEDHLPPTSWMLGRITKTYPGEDEKVRVVDVRTRSGTFKRGITKLSLLPNQE